MASFRTDEQKLEFLSARINRRPDPPFIPLSLIPYIYYILYYILIDRVYIAPPKGGANSYPYEDNIYYKRFFPKMPDLIWSSSVDADPLGKNEKTSVFFIFLRETSKSLL